MKHEDERLVVKVQVQKYVVEDRQPVNQMIMNNRYLCAHISQWCLLVRGYGA
jgi:hypothetical protein